MIVKVVYFASARDLASSRSETLAVREGSSVRGLAAELMKRHPPLEALEHSVRFSVNLDVADQDTALHEGDEVGVLPPVAGG